MSKVADLINLQIEYLETTGVHEAQLPNFMSSGCLKKTSTGEIEYDLGPDAFSACPLKAIISSPKKRTSQKRKAVQTPQKGHQRKLPLTSTPVKDNN